MSIHEAIFSPLRQPLLGVLYLLLTLQMALFLMALRDRRSLRLRLSLLLHLLLSFAVLWLCFLDIDGNYFRTNVPVPLPPARSAFTALLPAWSLVLYEGITALLLAAAIRDRLRWRREHPAPGSIKETLDLLPAGIAYAAADGTVVFRNLTMESLSRALTGKGLTDLAAFRQAAGVTGSEGQADIPGGRVRQFAARELSLEGESFTQLAAWDITDQARITRELEEKNEKLRELQRRLDAYNRQADHIIIAQELLTARMAVHSELGSVLLESRRYLTAPGSYDEEKLLQALKNTNTYLLREYEQDDTVSDPLSEAVAAAAALGVEVSFSGPIPGEGSARSVLAAAVGECASNTVKHAGGDSLAVTLRAEGASLSMSLRGSGRPPEGPVREGGGLTSLRTLAENAGGSMELRTEEGFTVILRLPRHQRS